MDQERSCSQNESQPLFSTDSNGSKIKRLEFLNKLFITNAKINNVIYIIITCIVILVLIA